MMGFHTDLGTADASCTTSHGPMMRRLPLLHHGAVGGLAHTVLRAQSALMCSKIVERFSNALIVDEPRARHPGSEQEISHPPSGGAAPGVPCLDGQVRNVPPVTDGSGIRRRLPASGPGYDGPSTASGLEAVDCITGYDTMLSNSFAPAGKPAPPVPVVAQYRVGFLPIPRNLRFLVCERIAKRFVNAVNGGVSASEER